MARGMNPDLKRRSAHSRNKSPVTRRSTFACGMSSSLGADSWEGGPVNITWILPRRCLSGSSRKYHGGEGLILLMALLCRNYTATEMLFLLNGSRHGAERQCQRSLADTTPPILPAPKHFIRSPVVCPANAGTTCAVRSSGFRHNESGVWGMFPTQPICTAPKRRHADSYFRSEGRDCGNRAGSRVAQRHNSVGSGWKRRQLQAIGCPSPTPTRKAPT